MGSEETKVENIVNVKSFEEFCYSCSDILSDSDLIELAKETENSTAEHMKILRESQLIPKLIAAVDVKSFESKRVMTAVQIILNYSYYSDDETMEVLYPVIPHLIVGLTCLKGGALDYYFNTLNNIAATSVIDTKEVLKYAYFDLIKPYLTSDNLLFQTRSWHALTCFRDYSPTLFNAILLQLPNASIFDRLPIETLNLTLRVISKLLSQEKELTLNYILSLNISKSIVTLLNHDNTKIQQLAFQIVLVMVANDNSIKCLIQQGLVQQLNQILLAKNYLKLNVVFFDLSYIVCYLWLHSKTLLSKVECYEFIKNVLDALQFLKFSGYDSFSAEMNIVSAMCSICKLHRTTYEPFLLRQGIIRMIIELIKNLMVFKNEINANKEFCLGRLHIFVTNLKYLVKQYPDITEFELAHEKDMKMFIDSY